MNKTPLNRITEADMATYQKDGVVLLRAMFDAQWVDHLRAAVAEARAKPGPFFQDHTVKGEATGFFSDLQMSLRVPAFRTFAEGSPLGEIAGRLMQSFRVNFLQDAMWLKEPGTSRRTPWHHDQPFYCMEGDRMCIVWLPLDPVARETSLQCLAGSHRWGRKFRPERVNGGWYDGYGDGDGFEPPPSADDMRRDRRVVSWDMEPGDCMVFHGMTLHGSEGNASNRPRRAVSFVLVGDDAVFVERGKETQPDYKGAGLRHGDPIDNAYFYRLWTRAPGEMPGGPSSPA
jgi:ectoine hydroxylase-related dioxygenase (phytanoyl-CoA dioxygenase family)